MLRTINSYVLPDSTLDKMIELVDKHIVNHKEYGFNLCLTKSDNIINGEVCEGTKCNVEIGKSCKDNEKYIGSYHTHYLSFFPSALDLYSGYPDEITCIGDKEKIVCLKKKIEVKPEILKALDEEPENYNYKSYKSSDRFVKYISVFDEIDNILKTVKKLEDRLKKKNITDVEYYDSIKDTNNKLADLVRFNYKTFVYKHGEPLTVENIEKMQKWEEESKR